MDEIQKEKWASQVSCYQLGTASSFVEVFFFRLFFPQLACDDRFYILRADRDQSLFKTGKKGIGNWRSEGGNQYVVTNGVLTGTVIN